MLRVMDPERALGEAGLEQAIQRLHVAGMDRTRYLIPFAESLMWIYALHQWHRGRARDPATFHAELTSTVEGQNVEAIVWARGSVQHFLDDVTKTIFYDDGRTTVLGRWVLGQGVLGHAGTPQLRWVELDRMREPTDRHGRHLWYERHVGAKPITAPLQVAQEYFTRL